MCAGSRCGGEGGGFETESSQKQSTHFGGFVDWNQDVILEITESKVCATEIVIWCEMCIHIEGHHIQWLL